MNGQSAANGDEPLGPERRLWLEPLGPERRLWLERVIDACERAAEQLPDQSDPYLRTLLADIEELRSRLVAELRAAEPEKEPDPTDQTDPPAASSAHETGRARLGPRAGSARRRCAWTAPAESGCRAEGRWRRSPCSPC